MCTWRPRWTTSVGSWAWRASMRRAPATTSSWPGSARSEGAPAPPDGPGRGAGMAIPADAVEAARAALSGRAQGAGKTRDGNVEAVRALVVAKRSARSTRIRSLNQIRHLGFTAPDELRERLRGVSRDHLGPVAAGLRPGAG